MGDAAPPPEPVDARFESFLDAAADASLPEDIRAQIRAGLTRQHANPPVRPTEAILRSRLTPTRVRELAYYPDDDDAELYALLIRSPPDGAPSDHPAARCQVTYLMTLYLSHSKRWAFAKRFVLAGGLVTLVNLLDHDDLRLRGQAMETFVALTHEELYPWHDPPERSSTSDVAVHRRMLELAASPLISRLCENFKADATFPGGARMALRTFAFYASWLRLRHCPHNVLRLSPDLLELLRAWESEDGAGEEEKALAKALADDFGGVDDDSDDARRDAVKRAMEANGGVVPTLNGPVAVRAAMERAAEAKRAKASAAGEEEEDDDDCVVVADRTVKLNASTSASAATTTTTTTPTTHTSSSSSSKSFYDADADETDSGEVHKTRGNEAFSNGRYTDAIRHYGAAVDAPVSYGKLFDEAPRRAAYHANRAAAYLARGGLPGGGKAEVSKDVSGHLMDAVVKREDSAAKWCEMHAKAALLDCDAALEFQPGRAKAKYRRATALWRLGRIEEANKVATSALHGADGAREEGEVRALLATFESPFRSPPEAAADDADAAVDVIARGLASTVVGGEEEEEEEEEEEGGGGGGGLLASMLGGGANDADDDARAAFVSEKGAALRAEEESGVAALGADGDELYDLD